MRHLPTALAALALAISAATHAWVRRELRRQRQAADYRWKAGGGRNDLAARLAARQATEDEHRLTTNGYHPAGGNR